MALLLRGTACNRTYFGEVGRTYELEIRRPREDRLPFLCHLNFTAGGGSYGDLIQLTFDTFTVGKFVSFTTDGCPDGHMSIREVDRPASGGQWCGSAWGYTVYYSEAPSLNVSLQLDRLSQQGIGYNFDFKLAYKFLRRSEAKLRYGNSSMTTWRGELETGTYCDRILTNCDRRPCRIQSPNYPGVYPRNITCRYRIEQRLIPRGKHALLAVRQTNSHKVHIKDQIVKYDRSQRVLRVWDQCNVVQDYLTFYDGPNSDDPVLVRLCGGDSVPDIVSSGPDMLLEFHTSPYDNPFHPVPLSYLPGFELEVQVVFVDLDSQSYVREKGRCEFLVTTFHSSSGTLANPRHSLPPNTTCKYHFQGRPNEIVWISFIKYHSASIDSTAFDQGNDGNATQLKIWDGRLQSPPKKSNAHNLTLLGEFSKDEVPRLCDHTLLSNNTRFTRPCSLSESYVSSGPELTIEHFLKQGSALSPVSFLLRYEFVDVSQEGIPNTLSHNPCDRIFKSQPNTPAYGRFQAPRSTFFYGRGGSQNLSCIFRFEAGKNERVRLSFNKVLFGDKSCVNKKDIRTQRWKCDRQHRWSKIFGIGELQISEYPWPGINLPRDCICTNITEPFKIQTLTSQIIEVNFTITFMNITQDFNDFYFEGEYFFVPKNDFDDEICASHWGDRRLRGTSGEIALRSPEMKRTSKTSNAESIYLESDQTNIRNTNGHNNKKCVHQPWLIEPEDAENNYLYLKIRGREIISSQFCATTNRIIVYSGSDTQSPRIICPASSMANDENDSSTNSNSIVEIFSEGWKSSSLTDEVTSLMKPQARSFVVEFLQSEPGNYVVTWMEVSKRPLSVPSSSSSIMISTASSSSSSSSFFMTTVIDCPYRCPELNACISESLWCDNLQHCPSGFDEEESNCAYQFGVPVLYILIGASAFGILIILIIITACIKYCQHRRREKKKHLAQQINNTQITSNHIHHHVNHHHLHHNMNHTQHHSHHGSSMMHPQSHHHNGSRGTLRHYHHHHNSGGNTTLEDMYLDGKDSLC
ncbi:uncharacterized protein LOC123292996 [Chrysoperla carnea]|uniref:uncharacterized protein LOC123292996 n=1 Tax=Chrysoperla carnea TaxID=189513 RepID=UPI001D08DED1|nr:uncharacterized protein LOC123292996 [Chrysoperla carnea]